jgi:hypothetical protein
MATLPGKEKSILHSVTLAEIFHETIEQPRKVASLSRALRHWDRGFESHLEYEFIYEFLLCLCCYVHVEALRWADLPPSSPTNFL